MTPGKKVTSIYVDQELLRKFRQVALSEFINGEARVQGAFRQAYEEAMILWLALPSEERQIIIKQWRNGENATSIDSNQTHRLSQDSSPRS